MESGIDRSHVHTYSNKCQLMLDALIRRHYITTKQNSPTVKSVTMHLNGMENITVKAFSLFKSACFETASRFY
jgi:hypothetical protein